MFEKFTNGGELIDCLATNQKKEEVVEKYAGRGKPTKRNDIHARGSLQHALVLFRCSSIGQCLCTEKFFTNEVTYLHTENQGIT